MQVSGRAQLSQRDASAFRTQRALSLLPARALTVWVPARRGASGKPSTHTRAHLHTFTPYTATLPAAAHTLPHALHTCIGAPARAHWSLRSPVPVLGSTSPALTVGCRLACPFSSGPALCHPRSPRPSWREGRGRPVGLGEAQVRSLDTSGHQVPRYVLGRPVMPQLLAPLGWVQGTSGARRPGFPEARPG